MPRQHRITHPPTNSHFEESIKELKEFISSEINTLKSDFGQKLDELDNKLTRVRDEVEFVRSIQSLVTSGVGPQNPGLSMSAPGTHVHEPRSMFRPERPLRR